VVQPFIQSEQQGRILILTINRPEVRNSIATVSECEEFAGALDDAQTDNGVSCIVLTGAGSTFSSGGNLTALRERNGIARVDGPADATRVNYKRGVQRMVQALWNCDVPTVAAINGAAIGLGLDLACLCDIRIATEAATFAASFVKLGLIPGDGGSWILPRIVGLSNAAELILTGDPIDARTAFGMGLIGRTVPAEHLIEEAMAIARRIVVNPPRALRLAKRLLREGQQQRFADILELSAASQALMHETPDHIEALNALLERRAPRFGE
jgi:enoyl-CoA hydratase/carnithine racemase